MHANMQRGEGEGGSRDPGQVKPPFTLVAIRKAKKGDLGVGRFRKTVAAVGGRGFHVL